MRHFFIRRTNLHYQGRFYIWWMLPLKYAMAAGVERGFVVEIHVKKQDGTLLYHQTLEQALAANVVPSMPSSQRVSPKLDAEGKLNGELVVPPYVAPPLPPLVPVPPPVPPVVAPPPLAPDAITPEKLAPDKRGHEPDTGSSSNVRARLF